MWFANIAMLPKLWHNSLDSQFIIYILNKEIFYLQYLPALCAEINYIFKNVILLCQTYAVPTSDIFKLKTE